VVGASGHGHDALRCLIEIDCGEHRSGVEPAGNDLVAIARTLNAKPGVLQGVMTHAGHSYSTNEATEIANIAETERRAAVGSAERIRTLGFDCPIVSVGSTPTVLHARTLLGVTEARCGIYMFWDLAQYSRGMCTLDDIAVSVLSTVIGHNRAAGSLVIDAGALALSKDIGANTFMPHIKYGLVCDPETAAPIDGLSVIAVHQEHGTVSVPDPEIFERLPIDSLVRVLPNHACLTCAIYGVYNLVGADAGRKWSRTNGW
jgi:D-serine deaminase-like pyridoxal phosphate-dependent protein